MTCSQNQASDTHKTWIEATLAGYALKDEARAINDEALVLARAIHNLRKVLKNQALARLPMYYNSSNEQQAELILRKTVEGHPTSSELIMTTVPFGFLRTTQHAIWFAEKQVATVDDHDDPYTWEMQIAASIAVLVCYYSRQAPSRYDADTQRTAIFGDLTMFSSGYRKMQKADKNATYRWSRLFVPSASKEHTSGFRWMCNHLLHTILPSRGWTVGTGTASLAFTEATSALRERSDIDARLALGLIWGMTALQNPQQWRAFTESSPWWNSGLQRSAPSGKPEETTRGTQAPQRVSFY